MAERAPVLVLGYGNPGRGDDALGPLLLAKLEAWLPDQPALAVDTLCDMQLNIEHVLEVAGRQRVLLIDAARCGPLPFTCRPVTAQTDFRHSTHTLSPAGLLALCHQVGVPEPASTELLAIPGEAFALGDALSDTARQGLAAAWPFLQAWCRGTVMPDAPASAANLSGPVACDHRG